MAKGDTEIIDGVKYVQLHDDGYPARHKRQLDDWVAGTSNHNTVDGECCPDFSCCNDKADTPTDVRERFARAVAEKDEKTKMAMLGGFLGQMLATQGIKAHIAGDGGRDAD